MRLRKIISVTIVLVITLLIYLLHQQNSKNATETTSDSRSANAIHIAVVACGERLQETLTMIKSALLFNHSKELLRFLIFAESHLIAGFREKLEDWKALLPQEFDYELLPLNFPPEGEWRSLFKPCAAQRLFLPVS